MEELKLNALVINEIRIGEADKLLTLLTEDHGKILVSGKGVASLRSRHMTSAQLFSYSSFVLRKSKKYFYIADSDMLECFFNIRYDVEKLALASYMCDVACDLALENVSDPELLRLMLNSLYALANKKSLTMDQVKATFEFRAACQAGYLPMLDKCKICEKSVFTEQIIFDIMNGSIRCSTCASIMKRKELDEDGTAEIYCRITPSVLEALRFIVGSPLSRFLSFSIPDEEAALLSYFTETYLISHLEHSFKSLKYYKDIRLNGIDYE